MASACRSIRSRPSACPSRARFPSRSGTSRWFHAVDKAIRDANLGLSPTVEGTTLRIRIPELNEQRRKEMVKVAHKYTEDARVAVRHVRRDGLDVLKKLLKEHAISEDDEKRHEGEVQKATDEAIKDIDACSRPKKRKSCKFSRGAEALRMSPLSDTLAIRSRRSPTHVAIIMDGNGRWAQARGLPRFEGHRRGVEAVRRAVRAAIEFGVSYLTIYSFSTENWNRPADEVSMLMGLLKRFIRNDLADLHANDVRVRVIGRRGGPALRHRGAADRGRGTDAGQSRPDAGRRLQLWRAAGDRRCGAPAGQASRRPARIDPDTIDAQAFEARLETADIPDPDLIIRTSGEQRLSNFLLWQAAYAEFVFLPIHWPDFDKAAFQSALDAFCRARAALRRRAAPKLDAHVKSAS